jgi:hypothetical protein
VEHDRESEFVVHYPALRIRFGVDVVLAQEFRAERGLPARVLPPKRAGNPRSAGIIGGSRTTALIAYHLVHDYG